MQLEVLICHRPVHAGATAFVIPGTGAEVVTQKAYSSASLALFVPSQLRHHIQVPRTCKALLLAGMWTVEGTKPAVVLPARISVSEGLR